MVVNKSVENDELKIAIEGRLDSMTAPELEKEINESIEGMKKVTFDFKDLEYISSAGLRVLLATQKTMLKQGEMVVMNLSEAVQDIFEVTGFSDILTVI